MNQYQECYFKRSGSPSLYYRDHDTAGKEAPAIICLHGVTRNSKDFEELAVHLARQWRVIVPDVRGRGKSGYDKNWHNYQLAVYAEDIWALATHLRLDRFVLIGTSMGGLISITMASQQRHRLAAVVLNDIGPEIAPLGIARIFDYMGENKTDYSLDDVAERLRAASGHFFPDMDEEGWRKQALRSHKPLGNSHYGVDYDNQGIIKALSEAGLPGDHWEMFSCLDELPVLLLHGELSDLLTVEIVDKMRASKIDLQVVTIPRVGHAPLLEEPESVLAIDQFLLNINIIL